mgnify:CR=1 FL=1
MLSANQGIGMFAGFPYVRTYTGLNLLNGEYSSLLVFSGNVYMRGINLAGTSTRILAKHDAGNAVEVKYQPVMTVEESAVVASPDIVSSGFKKESGSAGVEEVLQIVENDAAVEGTDGKETMIPVRENFAETAFFLSSTSYKRTRGACVFFLRCRRA